MQRAIPQVNLAQFIDGNDAERQAFVNQIGEAFESVGFVSVVNHGIPQPLIDQLYNEVTTFSVYLLKPKAIMK